MITYDLSNVGDYKQVIVVRTDIKMPKGKLAAQVAHASVLCALESKEIDSVNFNRWLMSGFRKVVLKVGSEAELEEVYERAKKYDMITYKVHDAGLTVLEPNTLTCVGIGPYESDAFIMVTDDLKLL